MWRACKSMCTFLVKYGMLVRFVTKIFTMKLLIRKDIIVSPQQKGGAILFCCGPRRHPLSFVSMRDLLNQRKELTRFWWPWPYFRFLWVIFWTSGWIFTKHAKIHCWEELIWFCWPWSNFKGQSYTDCINQPFPHTIFWTGGWILTKLA